MKFFLQKNWSDQFGYEKDKSKLIFIGRDREVKSLKHAITNNTSSTILVSSVRGVGKTSFVHRTLSEIRNEVTPIFVNVGHTLREKTDEQTSVAKEFLVSLIRAAYLTNELNDKEIERLYYQSIGTYKEEEQAVDDANTTTTLEFSLESKKGIENSIRLGLVVLGTTLGTLGIFTDVVPNWLGYIGFISLPFSVNFKTSWLQKISRNLRSVSGYTIDSSPEYLETRFEQWLEKKRGNKHIVFVVDELDRDPEESFNAIKEYKNLFARSFAHFIFISNQKAYDLTQLKRADSKYPTLFTHVYYLPTPTSGEMESYLDKVFAFDSSDEEAAELKHYLLFHSANDFFNLKNLINDLSEYDATGKQYIDTDTLKRADRNYKDLAQIYTYIDCFYQYYARIPKLYWQANSKMQEEVFSFVKENIGQTILINVNESKHVNNLVLLLHRIGVLELVGLTPEEESVHAEDNPLAKYSWTGQYRELKSFNQLFPEDEEFISAMQKLIGVANDLDDLPKKYKDNSFEDYEDVSEDADGADLTGISLYSIYEKNEDLYNNLQSDEERLYARAEEAKEGTKEIEEALKNALANPFNIFTGALETALAAENGSVSNTPVQKGINPAFALTSWQAKFAERPSRLFYTISPQKQVLVISGVLDFGSNREVELAELRSNKDILVLNFYTGSKDLAVHPSVGKDASGRKRKGRVPVDNFFNFKVPTDVRELAKPLRLAAKHLSSD